MKHEFLLADIGEGLEEAEIITWLVQVGDVVTRDQPLIEVMTDKSNAELPAPTAGTVVSLGGAVGDILHVGAVIAVIDATSASGDAVSAPSAAAQPDSASQPQQDAAVAGTKHVLPDDSSVAPASVTSRVKASPATRRAAAAQGIDLSTVVGSGPGGRILLDDLAIDHGAQLVSDPVAASEAASSISLVPEASIPVAASPVAPSPVAASPAPAPPAAPQPASATPRPSGTVPLRGIRRAISQNMTQSWSEIPHIHAFEHIDAEPLIALRSQLKNSGRSEYEGLTPLAFFVAAVAAALHKFPQANASLNSIDETITYHPHSNVGLAVAAPAGLVVPVLHHAEAQDFTTLVANLRNLVAGARAGTLPREHFTGGTATVTNFGSLGGEQATPLIRPPESVILGFGAVAQRPFVIDGAVVARKTMHLVIGADHRLIDGDIATAFIRYVAALLAAPLQLVL